MTLKELFDRSCSQHADRAAVSFVNGTPLTYADMKHEVEKTTELLGNIGVHKSDRVAVLSANMPNWCIAYFAIVGMGAVVVPILPDFHPDEIQNILQHSGSKAIFVSQKYSATIDKFQSETLTHKIAIEDFSLISGEYAITSPPSGKSHPVETDTASIIFTSGTTGRSKGVMLSHRNITVNAEMCLQVTNTDKNDVFLSILPLSHAYENTLAFIMPFMMGASIYYLEKPPTASVLIPALEKVRPTSMASVPLVIEKLYRNQVQEKMKRLKPVWLLYNHFVPFRKIVHYFVGIKLRKTFGGRLRFFGIGGARIDAIVERFLREARFPYAIGYGLTETSPLISGTHPSHVRFQSIGKALDGIRVKIDSPDPRTGVGELLVKGESVMQGYYRDPELTRSVFTDDGWFRSGDLCFFDKRQRLFLKGRLKTMIVGASGENIYPEDIESVINNVRGVLESLVLEQKGKLVAMVCLNMDELEKTVQQMHANTIQYISDKKEEWSRQKEDWNKQIDIFLEDLKNHVNHRVNRFSQIHSVILVSAPFEKTPTQKIKRYLYS